MSEKAHTLASQFGLASLRGEGMEVPKEFMSSEPNPNPSGINPTEYKVLVQPVQVEEKTKGGIIKPDMSKDHESHAQTKGRIIAASPLAFSYATDEEWKESGAEKPKPGDLVLFSKYAGFNYMGDDGVNYRLINDKDICATIEE